MSKEDRIAVYTGSEPTDAPWLRGAKLAARTKYAEDADFVLVEKGGYIDSSEITIRAL